MSEEKAYKEIFFHSPVPMWIYDLETLSFLEVNEAAIRHYGYSRDEFLTMTIKDIRPSDDVSGLLDNVSHVSEGLDKAGYWRHTRKDGSLIYVEIVSHTMRFKGRDTELVLATDQTERLRAEKACEESEQKYRELTQLLPQTIFETDTDGNLVFANKHAMQTFGYEEAELAQGLNVLDLVAPVDKERARHNIGRVLRGNTLHNNEYRLHRKDGSIIEAMISSGPIYGEGRVCGIRGMIADITRRKMVEKSMRENEFLLQSIFRSAPVGIGMVVDRVIKWANDKVCEITGYTPDELMGRSSLILYPSREDYDFVGKEKYRQIRSHGTGTVEATWQRKDGTLVDILLSSTPLDADNLHAGMVFTVLNITEKKKSQAELKKAKDEWERSFDAINDIITIQDRDMHIMRANKTTCKILGKDYRDIIGKKCYELFRGRDETCPCCPVLETLEDKAVHHATIEHEDLRKIFEVTSSSVQDENGVLEYIIHVAKDITEQKKLQEDLFQAHKMEAMGTLAGGIAHDFNNILFALLGYAEMTRENVPSESIAVEYVDQVIKAGNRASELVRQILTFSRKHDEERQAIQPSTIIKEAMKLMHASLPSTIEIREEVDSESGSIAADPTNLHQILVNLCTNALHAMENEKGVLTVRLSRVHLTDPAVNSGGDEKPFVELVVSDTGSGMDDRTMERIFEPYFTTKEAGRGSGMGLALVYSIVKDYGGFVDVESVPGKGTAMSVYFPVLEERAGQEKHRIKKSIPRGSERILVVDDEESVVKVYMSMLERLGYSVISLTESRKALEVFEKYSEDIDLVLTDQTMPGITGEELAREILKIRPDLPIIVCSGYSSTLSEEEARGIGIDRFITKPVSREDLAVAIREVLEGRQIAE